MHGERSPGGPTANSPISWLPRSCRMPRENRAQALAWLGFAVRLGAAAVWLMAGAAKVPQIQAFRVLVQRYGILPDVLAGPFSYVLPFLEIAIGLYLAVGLFVRGTAVVGTFLFAVFLAAQVSAWTRGISLDCGCFGAIA